MIEDYECLWKRHSRKPVYVDDFRDGSAQLAEEVGRIERGCGRIGIAGVTSNVPFGTISGSTNLGMPQFRTYF